MAKHLKLYFRLFHSILKVLILLHLYAMRLNILLQSQLNGGTYVVEKALLSLTTNT